MSDNNVVIEVDGNNFEHYKTGSVSRKFDEFCGSFSFVATKDQAEGFNIDAQSNCNIYVNDKKAITGVIDKVEPSEDPNSSEVTISGRDITCDIVDSSLPTSIHLSGDFNLVTVIEKVVEALGLPCKVINQIEDLRPFTSSDVVSSEVDKNAFEFINEYAEKVSAILITDEEGNIVITRAGENRVPDKILNEIGNDDNNVESSSVSYDFSNRYNKYIVVSQGNTNTSTTSISIDSVSQKGEATDDEVRPSRVLVIKPSNACDSATCQEIATLEANVRRANSLNYSCVVSGFELNSGELYKINTLMQVIDNDCFIESELLVKGVSYDFGDGSTTTLEFGVADAYTMQANLDEIDARTNKTNSKKSKGKSGKSSSGKKTTKLSPEAQKKVNEILGVK